jgi:hypothetical protein
MANNVYLVPYKTSNAAIMQYKTAAEYGQKIAQVLLFQ